MTILGITSFNFLHAKLGKYWKTIHQFVFPLFLIAALHVAFSSHFELKYMIFIALVVFVRVAAFIKKQEL
jgi:DMSO/TMAO reductase YedYZ heme-binding membrane subunit